MNLLLTIAQFDCTSSDSFEMAWLEDILGVYARTFSHRGKFDFTVQNSIKQVVRKIACSSVKFETLYYFSRLLRKHVVLFVLKWHNDIQYLRTVS